MKINLVLLVLSIAAASGHKDPSLKARFHQKVGEFKDSIHGLKAAVKAAIKNKGSKGETDPWRADPPTTKCHTVFDEVWQEECGTKYNNSCHMEVKPICATISAKECSPEPKTSCSWGLENKCKTISVPSCSVDWEKRCTTHPICTTVERKVCANVEKDVCVDHMDKVCTMTSVKVCRKTAVREEVEDWPKEVEDWPTEVEDWPTTKGADVKVISHKAQKANFKNALLDKIEEHTDAKFDHIKSKIVKRDIAELFEMKGEEGDVVADFEDMTDTEVDHIKSKIVKRDLAKLFSAKAEKKAAIKAAKAQFKATLFGHKAYKAKPAAPTLKVKWVKSCIDEPRKTCTKLPRKICHKETVPVCTREPEESCVEKESCKSWPTKNCEMVHKETCWPFPTKKCKEVTTTVCKFVPRENCVDKTHEICEAIPIKECKKHLVKKPRQVCIPVPTIRAQEDW